MTRTIKPKLECDRRILLIVLLFFALGISLVASASSYLAEERFDDPYQLLRNHLVRVVTAVLFFLVAMRIDYRVYRRYAPVGMAASLLLLLGLFVSGHAARGALSWISVLNVTFQPAEVARVALVFFLAYWVARKGSDMRDFRTGFMPAALVTLFVVGLIAGQPDYGTATATAAIGFLVLIAGGSRVKHLAALGAVFVGGAAIRIHQGGHVLARLKAFFNPSSSLDDLNWQVRQSLIGMGSGGVFGIGFGNSRQKLHWLPDSHTDFIFSILGEEVGLIGTLLVSTLFLLIALRALKISTTSVDRFGETLVVGIGCSIFVYAAVNMAVATGLFPVTGLPLPFLSYGGSALVVNAFSVGVLLSVSCRRWHGSSARNRERMVRGRAA